MRILFTTVLLLTVLCTFAQKPPLLTTQEEVEAFVINDLDQRITDGDLAEWVAENGIAGTFIMDVTVQKKGQVVTVFVVENETGDLAMQRLVKDKIMSLKFRCKLPKNRRYKVRYTFNFST